jgi:metallo-beta-lactamase family protein
MNRTESSIRSYGGNGGLVTGSCHLYERGDNKIMVDMGMFQGRDEILLDTGKQRNSESISEICRGTSTVLVTHAHIDHTGRLPLIFKNGFTPNIYATEETIGFMEVLLYNSADIQEKDKNQIQIYTKDDVDVLLRKMKKVEAFEEIPIGNHNSKIKAQFLPNGHVTGSASIVIKDGHTKENILFTGDIGRPNQLLCGGYNEYTDRYPDCKINTVVTESTCSENIPVTFKEREANILEAITKTGNRGGNSLFPILNFHRLQETIEMLHNWQEDGRLSLDYKVIIDAPTGMKISEVFEGLGPDHLTTRYGDDPSFYKTDESSMNRFILKNSTVISSHEESKLNAKNLANTQEKYIILASGGMAHNGRSLNYISGEFNQNLKNSVVFTCYQVPGTKGADMLSEEEKVKLELKKKKKAEIMWTDGNTGHATGPEINNFIERFNLNDLHNMIVVHGRDPARKTLMAETEKRNYESISIFLPLIRQRISV